MNQGDCIIPAGIGTLKFTFTYRQPQLQNRSLLISLTFFHSFEAFPRKTEIRKYLPITTSSNIFRLLRKHLNDRHQRFDPGLFESIGYNTLR